jgi:hypothetical protein
MKIIISYKIAKDGGIWRVSYDDETDEHDDEMVDNEEMLKWVSQVATKKNLSGVEGVEVFMDKTHSTKRSELVLFDLDFATDASFHCAFCPAIERYIAIMELNGKRTLLYTSDDIYPCEYLIGSLQKTVTDIKNGVHIQ